MASHIIHRTSISKHLLRISGQAFESVGEQAHALHAVDRQNGLELSRLILILHLGVGNDVFAVVTPLLGI